MCRILVAIAAFLFAMPAHAAWHRAESAHFVIYADDSEKDLQRYAEMLERYHAAMAYITQREVEVPSPSNRVTVYAVGSSRNVRKLAQSRNVGGFYIPRAGGSAAFVPDVRPSYGELDWSTTVLLHEYAHHFLIGSSRFAMPRWMDEGGAEFFASARFPRSGEVQIGRPASHRAAELAFAPGVSMEQLFERGNMKRGEGNARDDFYGRSWALYHFLTFDGSRKGQLFDYAQRIAKGSSSIEAATAAFGDLSALEDDLDGYLKQRKLNGFVLQPDLLPIGPITITRLSEGMEDMMPVIIQSKRGVNPEEAGEVVEEAREVAARYPEDADVLAALAEAELDAGETDRALAAADRALAIQAGTKNALIQRAYALFAQAETAEDADSAYADAMKPLSALNRLEQDHPIPLIYYYRSFAERGISPNDTARHALERAAQLSPFDRELALHVGLMQADEGKIALARHTLMPVATNPHGGGLAVTAQSHLDALADVDEGTRWHPRPALRTKAISRENSEETES